MDTVRLRILQEVDHVRQVSRIDLPSIGGCEDAARADVVALKDAHRIEAPPLGLAYHPADIPAIVKSRVERHMLDVAASHIADFEIVKAERAVGLAGSGSDEQAVADDDTRFGSRPQLFRRGMSRNRHHGA